MVNFKGIYYGEDNEKYTDEKTGAHFRYKDLCRRIDGAKIERTKLEKEWLK